MRRALVILGIVVVLAAAVGVTYSAFSSSSSNNSNSLSAASSFVGCDYPATVQGESSLVSYWRLGETSGTTAADSKGTNNGTITGGVTLNQTGLIAGDSNKSMSFDGSSGYINVPFSATLNPVQFTVEGWVINPSGSSVREIVSSSLNPTSRGYKLYADGSSWQFRVSSGVSFATASSSSGYVAGALTHVVGTYDGLTLKLYVNGALAATTADATYLANLTQDLRIGASSEAVPSEFFSGRIDEAAVYNTALGTSAVQNHFRCGQRYRDVVLDTSSLVSYWHLGEPAGTVAFDGKGTNNGIFTNGVTLGAAGALTAAGDTSASFDGTNDYVNVPDAASLRPASLTVEAWVKANTGIQDWASAVTKASDYHWTDGWGLYQWGGGNIYFWINNYNDADSYVGTTLTTNTWTHIVGTYDGTTIKLYKNGALVDNDTPSPAGITHSTQPLMIGNAPTGPTTYNWPGNLESVAIYNTALSATDVLQHYNAR